MNVWMSFVKMKILEQKNCGKETEIWSKIEKEEINLHWQVGPINWDFKTKISVKL